MIGEWQHWSVVRIRQLFALIILFATLPASLVFADTDSSRTIYFAGFGYASTFEEVPTRFPHLSSTFALEQSNFDHLLFTDLPKTSAGRSFRLIGDEYGALDGENGALVLALIVDKESTSISRIGTDYKIVSSISFSTCIFDFDSKEIISSIPMTVRIVDLLRSAPPTDYYEDLFRALAIGDQPESMRSKFWASLTELVIPEPGARRIRVSPAILPAGIDWADPETLKVFGDDSARFLSRSIGKSAHIAMLPYSNSQALSGKMASRIANAEVFQFKTPEEDYAVQLVFDGFKKVNSASSSAGTVYVYGTFATISIIEPLSQRVLVKNSYKHGETKTVPASVTILSDQAAFDAVTHVLLEDFAQAASSADLTWEKSHLSGAQSRPGAISKFKEIFDSCR